MLFVSDTNTWFQCKALCMFAAVAAGVMPPLPQQTTGHLIASTFEIYNQTRIWKILICFLYYIHININQCICCIMISPFIYFFAFLKFYISNEHQPFITFFCLILAWQYGHLSSSAAYLLIRSNNYQYHNIDKLLL